MPNFKTELLEQNNNNATVVIEPLEQGYGHTLGNSLVRCMLNSLSGSAITSVKIDGVNHQFSTMPGVVEDILEIILNLKKVRVKIFDVDGKKTKSIKVTISKTGVGEVTGKDIDVKGAGEVVNPDQHIATLTDAKVKFNVELTVEVGSGYSASEERKSDEIGVMPIDAIFSPVVFANYKIEQTRVGRKTDYEKLVIDIKTDGTIEPMSAVNQAAEILESYFRQVTNPVFTEEVESSSAKSSFMVEDIMKASIEELDLPVRITNALKAIEIDTVENLLQTPRATLVKAKNLGAKSIGLISEKLQERGLSLGEA